MSRKRDEVTLVTPLITVHTSSMRHYLIVANQTAGTPELRSAISRRMAEGPCDFHVLVPVTGTTDLVWLAVLGSDPMSGYFMPPAEYPGADETATEQARQRLTLQLAQLNEMGAPADGELGDADPLTAISEVLADRSFDEILLSTLPAGISRWLSMDLPARAARRFGVSLVYVEAAAKTAAR